MRQAVWVFLAVQDVTEILQRHAEGADLVALVGGELVGGGGQRFVDPVPVPGDAEVLQAGGGGPVPRGHGEPDQVSGDEAPLVFAAGQGAIGGRVDEVGGDLAEKAGPLPLPPGPLVQGAQALQAADLVVPVPGVEGESEGVVQIALLRGQRRHHIDAAFLELVVVIAAEPGKDVGVGAGGVRGDGRPVGAVVQGGEVPGQGGVDGVVAAAQGGEQADGGGAVQQGDCGLAGDAGELRDRVLAGDVGVAHEAEGVGVDGVAEQVEDGELGALGFGEGVGEPVGERGPAPQK